MTSPIGPLDGIAGIASPAIATRAVIKNDRNDDRNDQEELARLVELATAELDGRKGAWLWHRHQAPPGSAQEIAAQWCRSDGLVLLGTADGVVLGFGVAHEETLHDGQALGIIDGLYVEEAGRSIGVGDALVLALIDVFRERGCVGVDAWALPGERETKNFYEAHTFSARVITVHHSFIGPTHNSRTEGLHSRSRGHDPVLDEKVEETID